MRLAIIGAGVSGLVAAHVLHKAHEVTLFEAAGYAGGHVNTVRVDTADETHMIDTGFIVYNERNYPNFTRLLRSLGVATKASTMSFSVHADGGDFEYSSVLLAGLYARPSHLVRPAFQRMVADYLRFRAAARRFLRRSAAGELTSMRDFLAERSYSSQFIERMVVPLGASIWSADRARFLRFPARYVLAFFDNHGLLSGRDRPTWRTVEGGSYRYVEALTRPFSDRIRLATPVEAVTRHQDGVEVKPRGAAAQTFDRVIIATHSDQALAMLSDATAQERSLLEAFPYQRNSAVLHSDASLLPRRRRAWASWNYHLAPDPDVPVGVTYHMNRLQGVTAERELCVTLNRDAVIDETQVFRRIDYAHPLYTDKSVRAQTAHDSINGVRRTYFCGAYWGTGFHEDGVNSALAVCAHFGQGLE